MVRAEVEGVEVEPLRLDLGAVGDLVAHRDEQLGDALLDGRQRMAGAGRAAVPGQRDVDRLLDEDPLVAFVLQDGLAGGQRLRDGSPRSADPLAGVCLRGRRQGADLAVGQRERRPVAGMRRAWRRLSSSRSPAAAIAARAASRARSTSSAFSGRHLHGVVGLVGCGHGIGSVGQRLASRANLVRRLSSRHRRASIGGVARARRPPTPSVQEVRGAGGQHESEQPAAAGRPADVDVAAVRLDETLARCRGRGRCRRGGRERQNWVKTRSCSLRGMPSPSSLTVTPAPSPAGSTTIVTCRSRAAPRFRAGWP